MTRTLLVDDEERWARVIELERLERNLQFARECASVSIHKPLWDAEVKRAEFELRTFKQSRTRQTVLTVHQ